MAISIGTNTFNPFAGSTDKERARRERVRGSLFRSTGATEDVMIDSSFMDSYAGTLDFKDSKTGVSIFTDEYGSSLRAYSNDWIMTLPDGDSQDARLFTVKKVDGGWLYGSLEGGVLRESGKKKFQELYPAWSGC